MEGRTLPNRTEAELLLHALPALAIASTPTINSLLLDPWAADGKKKLIEIKEGEGTKDRARGFTTFSLSLYPFPFGNFPLLLCFLFPLFSSSGGKKKRSRK